MGYYFSPHRSEYVKNREAIMRRVKKVCPFCEESSFADQVITDRRGDPVENAHYRWLVNLYPACEGHTLIVPKRHLVSVRDESPEEILAREQLIQTAAKALRLLRPEAGIEIFMQYGEYSRMSVPHLHTHVVLSLPSDPLRGMGKWGHLEAMDKDQDKVVVRPTDLELGRDVLRDALAKALDLKAPSGK